jgi:hypothetical protein
MAGDSEVGAGKQAKRGGNGAEKRAGKTLENRSAQPEEKPNRREHPRYSVDATARLTLVKSGIRMTGRILNLSMSGCRLRTDERFTVGIFNRVETEFLLNGMPFRLAGVSQSIQGKNTIGVRFVDISDRRREQLEELIAELAQPQTKANAEKQSAAGAPS